MSLDDNSEDLGYFNKKILQELKIPSSYNHEEKEVVEYHGLDTAEEVFFLRTGFLCSV